jgi:hypothetical protein
MVPQVAAVRVESPWHSRKRTLTCVAKLTRTLNRREREEMARFPEFSVEQDLVTYSCQSEESEAYEKRLSAALLSAARAAVQVVRLPELDPKR